MSEVVLNSQYNVRVSNNNAQYIFINTPYYGESYALAFNNAYNVFNGRSNIAKFPNNFSFYYTNNLYGTFAYCQSAYLNTSSPASGPLITNMAWAYWNCFNLTGKPFCGPLVTNMYRAYWNCFNLTGQPVCGNNVINMKDAYYNCINITGQPVCGPNVTDMHQAYEYCANLTGSPVCGPNVTNFGWTYYKCSNLVGQPVCGPKVISFGGTYWNCSNLVGKVVCSPTVETMGRAYSDCYKLTGNPIFGESVRDICWAYSNCTQVSGICYINRTAEIGYTNFQGVFMHCKQPITVYVKNWNTFNNFFKIKNVNSIVGEAITWTWNNDTTNGITRFENKGLYNLTVIYNP